MKQTLEASGKLAQDEPGIARAAASSDVGRWALLTLCTAAFMLNAASVLSVAPLAPLFRDDLGLSRGQVGLFLSAVYLGGVLMSLPAGWVMERLGIRATLTGGLTLTGVMVAGAAWSPSFPAMLACLFVSGFGFAVVNPTTGKAILERFPARERGFAMGIKQTGLTLGGVTAALTLPSIGLAWGWRVALSVAAGASLAGAVLALVGLERRAEEHRAVAAERPRMSDVTPFLARRSFVVLLACGLALSVAQSSLLAYLALFARETWAFTLVGAGGLLALAQLGGTAGRLGWGIISDRFFGGRRRPGLIVNGIIGACMSVLFASAISLPVPIAGVASLVAGIGAFGWVGLYLALTAEVGGPRHAGLLTGLAVSCSWSGVLLGPPLFGLLLEGTGSYHVPWLCLAATSTAAAVALSRIPPLVKR